MRAKQKDNEGARNAYQRCLDGHPTWWPAVSGLAAAIQASEAADGIAKVVTDLKDAPATKIEGLVLEGYLASAGSRFDAAIRAYDRALELEADPTVALQRYRAQTSGHLPGAQADLRAWLARRPGDDSVRLTLANDLQASGDVRGATVQYEDLAKRTPNNAVILNDLAWAYFLGRDPRALDTARQALRLAPTVPANDDTLGWILVNSGAVAEGLGYLQRAAGAAGGQAEIEYHFGAALARAGQSVEAIRALDRALASGDAFGERADAIALRDRLKAGPGG